MLSRRTRKSQKRNKKRRKHTKQKHWAKYQQDAHKHQIF